MQEAPFKIYNASAGSGKTYTLAKAYLRIVLSSPKGYRQILAITFTNKAVNEMKRRILDSLFLFSLPETEREPSPMFDEMCSGLKIKAEELRERSRSALKEILHNYAYFDVLTIDKFTHRIIRTFARDLKLPQNFEVVLDKDLLLNEAVANLIQKAGEDEKLTKVLIDFALEKIEGDRSWDIAFDLVKIGELLFNENHAVHIKKLEGKELDDFLALQRHLKESISQMEVRLSENAGEALSLISENGLQFSDFTRSLFPNFMLKIRSGNLDLDFKAGWKQDFIAENLYNKTCPEPIKNTINGLMPQFTVLFNRIKEDYGKRSLLKNAYAHIVPLTVLNAVQNEIRNIQAERGQLSISEFNTLIADQVKDQPAPFIYERLGEKYRHYFVDEFQDTSALQWANLVPLIGNALESEDLQGNRGSLFLVGDAKQAIYRWRGGRAEQFLDLANARANSFVVPPKVETLPKNYRSREEIVNFNNDFFSTISQVFSNTTYRTLFEEGNKQEHTSRSGGYVELNLIEKDEEIKIEGRYCEEVLKIITTVPDKGYALKDITILVRKNDHGTKLADFLTQHDVPVISSESLLIGSSKKVAFLVNLLQYSMQRDLALGYDILAYLAPEGENRHDFIQEHLKYLEAFLKTKYGFEMDRLKRVSVYDGMEYAIKQFDLIDGSDAHLTYFMDTIFEVEQKEGAGIQVFLSYWEKKKDKLGITAPENVEAVQIMSVHKAKGLEFPIVIYPFANDKIYYEKDPKLWLPVPEMSLEGFSELLIGKKKEVAEYGPLAKTLYEEEHHKLELDALNVLYVALTRAEKALYIITEKDLTPKGEPKMDHYSGLFVHYLMKKGYWDGQKTLFTFGDLEPSHTTADRIIRENIPYLYSYKDRAGLRILAKSDRLWDNDTDPARTRGILVHSVLDGIETEKNRSDALDTLRRNGDLSLEETVEIEQKIDQIITHGALREFYAEGNQVLNERDILTRSGTILRPDRIVIKGNRATLIDYKTGKKDPGHHEQLWAYAEALQDMGYEIDNKIIVYINETIAPEFI